MLPYSSWSYGLIGKWNALYAQDAICASLKAPARILPSYPHISIDFAEAFAEVLTGARITASFLPENVFVELAEPDDGSLNTEPYLRMVTVAVGKGDNKEDLVAECTPWMPGSRPLFSKEWKLSNFTGEIIGKNGARLAME